MDRSKNLDFVLELPIKRDFDVLFPSWVSFFVLTALLCYLLPDTFRREEQEFISFFVCIIFLIYDVFLAYICVWKTFGREKLKILDGQLLIIKTLFLYKKQKKYETDRVRNIRVTDTSYIDHGFNVGVNPWKLSQGSIVFEYKGNTVFFGKNLDSGKAQSTVKKIRERINY